MYLFPLYIIITVNGEVHQHHVNNYSHTEISDWVELFRCQSGQRAVRLRKYWHTDTPSIQGVWTPITNRHTECNIHQYPNRQLAAVQEPSATQQLLTRAQQLRAIVLEDSKSD
jgi:large subunit ribosomal protein L43